jgi:formiminotetrahydrofolate cyclodeaminase
MTDFSADLAPDDFAEKIAAPTPTPGGGAVAARVGLYAVSLLRMVLSITLEKSSPGGGALADLQDICERARLLALEFRDLEGRDIEAFQGLIRALRLPRQTPEEKAHRKKARLLATRKATEAPLDLMTAALDNLSLLEKTLALAESVRLRAESDVGASLELTRAAFQAAELNVKVNLPALPPGEPRQELEGRHSTLRSRFEEQYPRLHEKVLRWLGRLES